MKELSEVFNSEAISVIKRQRSMRSYSVSTNTRPIKVVCTYKHNNKIVGVYPSLSQASKALNVDVRHLSNAVHNGRIVMDSIGLEYCIRLI